MIRSEWSYTKGVDSVLNRYKTRNECQTRKPTGSDVHYFVTKGMPKSPGI